MSAKVGLWCQLNRIQGHKWRSSPHAVLDSCSNNSLSSFREKSFWRCWNQTVERNFRNFRNFRNLKQVKDTCVISHRSVNLVSQHKLYESAKVTPTLLSRSNQMSGFHTQSGLSNQKSGFHTQRGLSNQKSRFYTQSGLSNQNSRFHTQSGLSNQKCGFHTQSGLSNQKSGRGFHIQSGLMTDSLQTRKSPLFRYIGTSPIGQKKKENKDIEIAKELEKKGDKSRKTIRKKVQPIIRQVPCQATVYAVGNELDFTSFKGHLAEEQLFDVSPIPDDLQNKVIHVTSRYQTDNYPKKDIFFFSEGSVVFWNVLEDERLKILKNMKEHCMEVNDMQLIMDESDSLEIQPTKLDTFLNNDVININEDQDGTDLMLVKYAFSNAMSQSVKLSIWETELFRHSQECEPISEALRMGSDVRMRKQKILKTLGAILAIRQSMNLGSELLDTPDFYWDRDRLGDLYKQCYNHLSVPHRIKVMNEKMSYCIELLELIKDLESDKRHIRLEWIIILLIALEVVLELRK